MKHILPDTNILINHPNIVKELVDKQYYVVIPVTVLDELDNLKLRHDLSHKVRETSRVIDQILQNRDKHLILTNYHKEEPGLNFKKADDRILAAACYYKEKGFEVTLLSQDVLIRLKSEGLGIRAVSSLQKLKDNIIIQENTPKIVNAPRDEITAKDKNKPIKLPEKQLKIEAENEPKLLAKGLSMGRNAYLIITSYTHAYQNMKLRYTVEGFSEKHLSRIKQILPGDRFVYYVAGNKEFVAIAEITDRQVFSKEVIWPLEEELKLFYRYKMKPIIILKPEEVLSAYKIVPKLKFVQNKVHWGAFFMGSIRKISPEDYSTIENEMGISRDKWKGVKG